MNKFMLNETSYHGAGAISALAAEINARGFKKGFGKVEAEPDVSRADSTAAHLHDGQAAEGSADTGQRAQQEVLDQLQQRPNFGKETEIIL